MGIQDIFVAKSKHRVWERLADDHVIGAGSGAAIKNDDGYFVVRLSEMYIRHSRKLWRRIHPMLHGFTEYAGNEHHAVIGPAQLQEISETNLDRIMNFNYRICGPVPYFGGDVDVLAGLYSVPGEDAGKALIDTVSTVAGLASVAADPVFKITEAVRTGVERIISIDQAALRIGVRDTFFPGAQNPLRSGFHVAIDAARPEVDFQRLWLVDGRLLTGTHPEAAVPYSDTDYLVLQIERRASRQDWPRLPVMADYNKKFSAIIASSALTWEKKKEELSRIWPEFTEAVAQSRDLISRDKLQIRVSVQTDLRERMKPAKEAAEGLVFESRGWGGYDRKDMRVGEFDFADVADQIDFTDPASLAAGERIAARPLFAE